MKYLKGHIIKELCLSDSIGIKETTLLNGYEITDIISKITIRVGGEFTHKAIYLPSEYNYILAEDDKGILILVPIKKTEEDINVKKTGEDING